MVWRGAGLVDVGLGASKLSELKASSRVALAVRDFSCADPDWLAPGAGAGAALGAEAYSDSIDCFRSVLCGRPEPVVAVALDGRAGGAEFEPPKKSRPSKDSPGFVCFA